MGAASGTDAPDAGLTATADAAAPADADPAAVCVDVTDSDTVYIGGAAAADDYALTITAHSQSPTSWGAAGNEALVLEVAAAHRGFIGHLILHQGTAPFAYAMHLGALDANEPVSLKVSTLSAQNATRSARVCGAQLAPVSTLPLADGIAHAPIYRWPVQKVFNDIPLLVGYSKAHKSYQTVMTNEDGGTAEICGGGASGMQAEIARWGRSTDIEGHYGYGGAVPSWERCTGAVPVTTTALRMEGAHPILYYGDGHNRVFESRGGYGQTCGTGSPEEPDGAFTGWTTQNPGNDLADDAGLVVVLRPLPVDMDALGYAQFGGRREGLADTYAPWMYRLSSLELAREGKIDNAKTLDLSRYLYVDVHVSDVGGSGDSYCSLTVSGGFKVRIVTKAGATISSPQITGDYVSGYDWKRVAIALPAGVGAADVDHFIFDAYDDDGIYLTGIGDAFTVQPAGANSAVIDYVRHGTTALQAYVDDDSSGCTGGTNASGPGGVAYSCVGGQMNMPANL
jgi:hypothetical protein